MGLGRLARWFVAVLALTLIGCGDDDDSPPAATLDSITSTTLSVEEEVEQAYLKSWDVYADAVLTFDTSRLDEVYDGPALEAVRKEVAELQAAGTPARTDVDHDYAIRVDSAINVAEVTDRYRNHSVLLDGESGEPIEEDPNEVVEDTYVLQLIEGLWKVVDIRRP